MSLAMNINKRHGQGLAGIARGSDGGALKRFIIVVLVVFEMIIERLRAWADVSRPHRHLAPPRSLLVPPPTAPSTSPAPSILAINVIASIHIGRASFSGGDGG